MAEVTQDQVEACLKDYTEPHLEKDLVTAKVLKGVEINGDSVTINLELGFPAKGYHDELSSGVKSKVESLDGVSAATVNINTKIVAHAVQKSLKPIANIRYT